jgi:hypothetical protein
LSLIDFRTSLAVFMSTPFGVTGRFPDLGFQTWVSRLGFPDLGFQIWATLFALLTRV